MYESKHQPLISTRHFARRLLHHVLLSAVLLIASLGLGMLGYCFFEGLTLLDSFLNAAMLLGAMGPVNAPQTSAGKLFAGLYALYAGLIFIVTAALMFSPLLHRVLHRLHMDS